MVFDTEGGLPLALARGAAVAALLFAFGNLVFRAAVLPKVAARMPQAVETTRPLASLARGSLLAAAVLLSAWGVLQSADLADAGYDGRRALAAVPGFAGVLSDEQRWALRDVIRARNAGLALQSSGGWLQPMALPGFSLPCPERDALATDDFRGRILYIVAEQPGALPPKPAGAGVFPNVLTREEPDRPACVSTDPAAWDALATVTGQSPDRLAGSRVLVDANGWTRALKAGPDAAAWDDPGAFATAVDAIAAAPITATREEGHHRH